MKKYVAAIDQGTTSTRCILFDRKGRVVSMAQKEHRQLYPQPGWVEHDPLEIWANTLEVMAQARAVRSIGIDDIAALGVTNQRETTVVWNRKSGVPYYNAIVWQDTRTTDLVRHYQEREIDDWYRSATGLPLSTYFSALKLRWLLDNVPTLRRDAEKGVALFGTIDSYLIWNLTGGTKGGKHVTDITNASRTQMMGIYKSVWDNEILYRMAIPAKMLPEIVPSSRFIATSAAEPLQSVPITGVLGDQQAALLGQACTNPGEAKNTYGTGCFLLMNTGKDIVKSKTGLLTTVAYQLEHEPPTFALEGSIAVAGALVHWLRDNLGIIQSSDEMEALARTVDDNGGVYFVPAFSGIFAPYWNTHARGLITGLTGFANKGHIARAALEATAFQTFEVLRAMEQDSDIKLASLRVDGGMVVNDLLMQFQSDILQKPVVRPKTTETTALGAAYAAGLAVGFWNSLADIRRNWGVDKTWEPQMSEMERKRNLWFWDKALDRSFDWDE
ncbi:MAG: glycerol kinase GlpK [Saprospiraceae bacterium]